MDPVDQGAQEDPAVQEVPVDQEDPEVLEGRVVPEDPVVREVPQRNLLEHQPKRQSQPETHLESQVDPVDQTVREDLEDPVVRVAREVPGDQEDQEVTYQNTLHLLDILDFFVNDICERYLTFDLSNFSIQFSRFLFLGSSPSRGHGHGLRS